MKDIARSRVTRIVGGTVLTASVLAVGLPLAGAPATLAAGAPEAHVRVLAASSHSATGTIALDRTGVSTFTLPTVAEAPPASDQSGRLREIIEAIKKYGGVVYDKLVQAARAGYEFFKQAWESVPKPLRWAYEAYEVYRAICDVVGC